MRSWRPRRAGLPYARPHAGPDPGSRYWRCCWSSWPAARCSTDRSLPGRERSMDDRGRGAGRADRGGRGRPQRPDLGRRRVAWRWHGERQGLHLRPGGRLVDAGADAARGGPPCGAGLDTERTGPRRGLRRRHDDVPTAGSGGSKTARRVGRRRAAPRGARRRRGGVRRQADRVRRRGQAGRHRQRGLRLAPATVRGTRIGRMPTGPGAPGRHDRRCRARRSCSAAGSAASTRTWPSSISSRHGRRHDDRRAADGTRWRRGLLVAGTGRVPGRRRVTRTARTRQVECMAPDGTLARLPDLGQPRHGVGAAVDRRDGLRRARRAPEPGLFVSDATEALKLP